MTGRAGANLRRERSEQCDAPLKSAGEPVRPCDVSLSSPIGRFLSERVAGIVNVHLLMHIEFHDPMELPRPQGFAMRQCDSPHRAAARILLLSSCAAILNACGGSGASPGSAAAPAATQTDAATQSDAATQTDAATPAEPPANRARPDFHLAPVFLEGPDATDRSEPMNSATQAPRRVAVDPSFAQLSTRRLTPRILEQVRDTGMAPDGAWAQGTEDDPLATTASATVYTPAQIRSAYGMPALISTTTSVTSAQAAQMGAGQTIYIIDAYDDPNVAAELASFDSNFGLPGCTVTSIPTSASLPLSAAPTTGCTFSIVHTDQNGAMTAPAPAYDSGWAVEIALDVQWAHATAPYARIILIEAQNSSSSLLIQAVQLADQMGPGVVSQSFGATETGSWSSSYDATAYGSPNMTYLAAAGDAGVGVDWPAVSSHVLAVAGTSLSYAGSGPRTETVWSGTGGGVSAYTATPQYQTLAVPGLGAPAHRAVADVSFNADPYTGQFVAVIAQGSTTVAYWAVGGTSLATPQWAGLIAVANALRAQSSLAPIGAAQPTLYGLGVQPVNYAGAFLDVTSGSDGTCTTCYAGVGYDLPSGLGSPNVAGLFTALSGQAPVVASATVTGNVGAALSFSITATDAHPLTYSLSGAPAGMSVNAGTGLVTWPLPLTGTYTIIASALDAQTGVSGQGTLTVTIVAPRPPVVAGGAVSGTAQTALSFSVQVPVSPDGASYSLSGAPAGMSVSANGIVTWPSPVTGSYAVTVIARDPVTGLTGQGVYTVTISSLWVVVPSVIGGSAAAAKMQIPSVGLVVGSITTQSSSSVPVGSVMAQNPIAGSSVARNSTVNLTVSSGPAPLVMVPAVVGLTQPVATLAITTANLVVGTLTSSSSATVPAGIVISESPAARASAATGSAVSLVVSTGPAAKPPAPVIVPALNGLTETSAAQALSNAGLALGAVSSQASSTVPAGKVLGQSPAAGSKAAKATPVSVVLSSGAAMVLVPKVIGLSKASAAAVLVNAGVALGAVSAVANSMPAGDVISQVPAANIKVARGSAVRLSVSTGPH
jgi:beta-lactam-binding protein with PASTA domain